MKHALVEFKDNGDLVIVYLNSPGGYFPAIYRTREVALQAHAQRGLRTAWYVRSLNWVLNHRKYKPNSFHGSTPSWVQ